MKTYSFLLLLLVTACVAVDDDIGPTEPIEIEPAARYEGRLINAHMHGEQGTPISEQVAELNEAEVSKTVLLIDPSITPRILPIFKDRIIPFLQETRTTIDAESYDINGDGDLSLKEYALLLSAYSHVNFSLDFSDIDTSGNGKISFVEFQAVVPDPWVSADSSEIDKFTGLDDSAIKYYGIGEVGLRHHIRSNRRGYGEDLNQICETAVRHCMPVLIHQGHDYGHELVQLLEDNPSCNIILAHAGDIPLDYGDEVDPGWLDEMMTQYANLYADLSAKIDTYGRESLLREYVTDGIPNIRLVLKWEQLFEKHSDRFLHAVDIYKPKHVENFNGDTVTMRLVLGQLSTDTASKIAHENIERLIMRVNNCPGSADKDN